MSALLRVSDNAEAAATHMTFLGTAFARLEAQLTRTGELLAALRPYVPLSMRGEMYAAGLGLYNACEEVADASGAVVGDYVGCLLLAQETANSLLSLGRDTE